MKNSKLNRLGLAQVAGKLESGEDQVLKAIRSGQAKLVFVASDASLRTQKKFKDKCSYYKIPINLDHDTLAISQALGKKRSTCALTDSGFAKEFLD